MLQHSLLLPDGWDFPAIHYNLYISSDSTKIAIHFSITKNLSFKLKLHLV